MSVKRLFRLWAVASTLAFGGLYLFHRYVEEKSNWRSLREAGGEYLRGMRWVSRRLLMFSREMRAHRE
ncbi:MAG: hypothetical protein ABEI31_06705 [Halodesulfurarchaeum sp.]